MQGLPNELDALIRQQNDALHELRGQLDQHVGDKCAKEILRRNGQYVPRDKNEVIEINCIHLPKIFGKICVRYNRARRKAVGMENLCLMETRLIDAPECCRNSAIVIKRSNSQRGDK